MKSLFLTLFILLSLIFSGCNETEDGYQGYVEVDYIHLAPQVSGRVVSLPVVRGQQVHTGDVVLQLDDTKEKLEIEALQAQLAGAQSVLDDLQTEKKGSGDNDNLIGCVTTDQSPPCKSKNIPKYDTDG